MKFKRPDAIGAMMLVAAAAVVVQLLPATTVAARVVPAPLVDAPRDTKASSATAVLAGGCFWGVEAVFEHVAGVTAVRSGYAGGSAATANYQIVGSGLTGHAEAVEIRYDPRKISYGKLLQIYFSVAHDPTELNRQGPDTGTQYRSTVFAQDVGQARIATAYVAQLNREKAYPSKVVTSIETGEKFYPAEAYHQNYLRLNPRQPYIVINDLPKIEALKTSFPALYQAKPVG